MPRSRSVLAGMLLLLALGLAGPAVSLAAGGGSAGDQQYTDPFSGGSGSGGSHTAATTSASASSTTPATPTGPADPTTAAADPTTAAEPTATIASPTSSTLPYTGYDAWTAVGFGLTLVVGGAVLRWRLHDRRP